MEHRDVLSTAIAELRAEHQKLTQSEGVRSSELKIERTRIAADLEAELRILEEQLLFRQGCSE